MIKVEYDPIKYKLLVSHFTGIIQILVIEFIANVSDIASPDSFLFRMRCVHNICYYSHFVEHAVEISKH